MTPHLPIDTRRRFVHSAVASTLLMPGLLSEMLASDSSLATNPLAPKDPHFSAKAKSVIFLFMSGGVSHVDSFDPKPKLIADHGKEVTVDHPETRNRPGFEKVYLKRPDWNFLPRGQSGIEVSDLFPHIASHSDDIAFVRSMHTSHSNHYNATLGMHTGSFAFARPSVGAWVSYGLGTVNQNLPSFLVLAPDMPYAGTQVWASDFLPGSHQGTRVTPGPDPIANLARRVPLSKQQELELDALKRFNESHRSTRMDDPQLAARIKSFETAHGMQTEMPAALDLSQETDDTPFNNTAEALGREHHNWAFSSWLAGEGVKRGYVHGATDEHGIRPVEKPVHIHDFHATILHLMGIDHERLTYRHGGRDYRLTDVHGNVVKEILV